MASMMTLMMSVSVKLLGLTPGSEPGGVVVVYIGAIGQSCGKPAVGDMPPWIGSAYWFSAEK